jgi:hypothetical protein
MASSNTEIANFALSFLGEPAILSLTATGTAASVMNLRYNAVRDATLRAHPWNFASTRRTLAKLALTPPFGFSTAFALPSDFLRVIRVNESSEPNLYKLELQDNTRVLLMDADTVELRYVARVTSESLFDPLFVEAFAARLAAVTAFKITRDWSIVEQMWALYQEKISEARSVDSMEDPTQHIEAEDFLEARIGFGSFRAIGGP